MVNEFTQKKTQEPNFPKFRSQERFQMDFILKEAQKNEIENEQSRFEIDANESNMKASQWVEEHLSSQSENINVPSSLGVNHQWYTKYGNNPNYIQDSFQFLPHYRQCLSPLTNSSPSFQSKWAQEYLEETELTLSNQDNKLDQNWSQEFASDSSYLQKKVKKLINSVKNSDKNSDTDFANFLTNVEKNQINVDLNNSDPAMSEHWSQEFADAASVWQNNAIQSDKEFWDSLAHDWEESIKNEDTIKPHQSVNLNSWVDEFEKIKLNSNNEYNFAQDNPYMELPNAFEEGLKKLKANDIPSAVLLFEASCQQNPSNSLHWQFLGTSQAQNEHDTLAIQALKKCIELEPTNLTALMALSVSYTNKSIADEAAETLKQWLACNPKYSAIVLSKQNLPVIPSQNKFKLVRDMYLQAARLFPNSPDADLQCGLGVLLNLSGEYDKAADCFKAALQVRPNDSILWNRLGATLANGNKSEKAIAAYRKALSLSPGFIRSRFNLGISCINLGAYQEAAEHFLTVLNLQNSGRGLNGQKSSVAMSNNVWTSLRLVVSLMNRQDLYKYVDNKDLNYLNREFKMNG